MVDHIDYLRRKTADESELWAADRIEQLETERDELLADAMRYRWLRENPEWIGYDSDFRPDEVDAAINAAIDKTEDQS